MTMVRHMASAWLRPAGTYSPSGIVSTTMPKPDINRLIELQTALLQFRAIKRTIHIPPGLEELENDTEHSYNLAILGWFLAGSFPELNRDRIIRLGLAHDLIELHAGDTYAYSDDAALSTKAVRE